MSKKKFAVEVCILSIIAMAFIFFMGDKVMPSAGQAALAVIISAICTSIEFGLLWLWHKVLANNPVK